MSAIEIINIASSYCTEIIKLNLEFACDASAKIIQKKLESLNAARTKIKISDEAGEIKIDINNDNALREYLADIYKQQLDNDKYGVNKRA